VVYDHDIERLKTTVCINDLTQRFTIRLAGLTVTLEHWIECRIDLCDSLCEVLVLDNKLVSFLKHDANLCLEFKLALM
jgi:hypothetical protein